MHDDALRTRLLDHAAETLSDDGPEGLSLRRLAAAVGTSTTAVYSLFGGKPALLAAVHREAFRRFGARIAAVAATDDPLADLRELARAYHRSAVEDPHMYAVLFARRSRGSEPDETTRELASSAFTPLVDAVRRGVEAGLLPAVDPTALATACWATAHGVVSLQLGGYLPPEAGDPGALFDGAMRAVARHWGTD